MVVSSSGFARPQGMGRQRGDHQVHDEDRVERYVLHGLERPAVDEKEAEPPRFLEPDADRVGGVQLLSGHFEHSDQGRRLPGYRDHRPTAGWHQHRRRFAGTHGNRTFYGHVL